MPEHKAVVLSRKRIELEWTSSLRPSSMEEVLYCEGNEALEQVSRRSCGHTIPGSVQIQMGWGFERRGLVKDVPAYGRRGGLSDL